jgi:formate hydrogenlyase subunit 3/multisubunit Na+/H+ antiporter MnhD subunit
MLESGTRAERFAFFFPASAMSPLIPLAILLLGTGLLLVSLSPRYPYAGGIAIMTALLALLTLFSLPLFGFPVQATLSDWAPDSLLPTALILEVDVLAWLFALATMTLTLAALLTGVVRPGGRRIMGRAAMLGLTLASLIAYFSDNLIARLLAWAGLDLVYFVSLVLMARGEHLPQQAALSLAVNSAGTLLMLVAAILIGRSGAPLTLRDALLTPGPALLIAVAAILRLGLFPVHLSLPTDAHTRQGLGTLLRLIPAGVALETVARLAVFDSAGPLRPVLTVFGVAAALVGALQLWNNLDVRQGLVYVVIAQSGVALLAGLWGTAPAALPLAGQTLALILGGGLIYLSNGFDEQRPWLTLFPGLGAATLVGAPLTIGFVSLNGLYAGLLQGGTGLWAVLTLVCLAQILLTAGLLRTIFWPGEPVEASPLLRAGYFVGLTLLAVFVAFTAVLIGVLGSRLGAPQGGWFGFESPSSQVSLGLVALTAAAGVGLWRFEQLTRASTESVAGLIVSLLRLEWLYRLLWNAVRLLSSAVNLIGDVLEGEGALLWTLAIILAVVLLFQ